MTHRKEQTHYHANSRTIAVQNFKLCKFNVNLWTLCFWLGKSTNSVYPLNGGAFWSGYFILHSISPFHFDNLAGVVYLYSDNVHPVTQVLTNTANLKIHPLNNK